MIGRVPEELTGRFLRIGPNPIDELDRVRLVRYHWFAGTGMAHGLRLRGGKAEWFRSRFVLDREEPAWLEDELAEGSDDGLSVRALADRSEQLVLEDFEAAVDQVFLAWEVVEDGLLRHFGFPSDLGDAHLLEATLAEQAARCLG